MSEMEDLKKNTQIAKAEQQGEQLVIYMTELDVEILDRMRWHARARNLELFTLLFHFSVIIALALQDVSYEQYGLITEISFLIFLLAAVRSSIIHTQQIGAIREYIGVIETLKILGMINDDYQPPRKKVKVKKWNLFSRYKEFWERITEGNAQEKYA